MHTKDLSETCDVLAKQVRPILENAWQRIHALNVHGNRETTFVLTSVFFSEAIALAFGRLPESSTNAVIDCLNQASRIAWREVFNDDVQSKAYEFRMRRISVETQIMVSELLASILLNRKLSIKGKAKNEKQDVRDDGKEGNSGDVEG